METTNKQISEEFSAGNFKFSYPYFADDIQWSMVGGSVVKGKEAVIGHCNKMLLEMANSTLTNTHQFGDNNFTAVQGYCDYTNDNNLPGRLEYCDIYRFMGEKLHEITSFCIEVKKNN